MSFAQAAQHYGMNELRRRFPAISHTTRREVLAWTLELLKSTLDHLSRPQCPYVERCEEKTISRPAGVYFATLNAEDSAYAGGSTPRPAECRT
jgi:hypothetical protein